MANQNVTLRHLLTQQKPHIPCTMTGGRNTAYEKWPKIKDSVVIWDEFNLDNLNESFGHVLDFAIPHGLLFGPLANQELSGVVIHTANVINHLISWNNALMKQTLQFAKSHLGLYPGISLHYKYTTVDKSVLASIPERSGKKLMVDHTIALDDFPMSTLVVGIGRESSKWSGRELARRLDNPRNELLWPLRQLANICEIAQTRYGYIQTNEELVVCCFSCRGPRFKVEIMPIPWTRSGAKVLTTDLALWWLCMLAMSPHQHRAIIEEKDMVKINDWEIVLLDEERGFGRRHRYSNVEQPASPSPPPGYATPSPNNAAALNPNDLLYVDPTSQEFLANLPEFNGTF